jgi:hypothetical protein
MTESGVIPRPEDRCTYCRGSGWITVVDYDDSGYDTVCLHCLGPDPPPRTCPCGKPITHTEFCYGFGEGDAMPP